MQLLTVPLSEVVDGVLCVKAAKQATVRREWACDVVTVLFPLAMVWWIGYS